MNKRQEKKMRDKSFINSYYECIIRAYLNKMDWFYNIEPEIIAEYIEKLRAKGVKDIKKSFPKKLYLKMLRKHSRHNYIKYRKYKCKK